MQEQDQNATVTTGTPVVTHDGNTTTVKTVVTTKVEDTPGAPAGGNDTTIKGEIAAGATQADYEALGNVGSPSTPFVDDRANKTDAEKNGSDAKGDSAPVADDTLSIEPFLSKVVDDDHRARVAKIIDKALENCGVNRGEMIAALQRETLQDTDHFTRTALEILRRSHMTAGSSYARIVRRAPGLCGIEMPGTFGVGQINRSINLMSMADGSLRLSFFQGTMKHQADMLVEDTPDADATVIVEAAYNWLQNVAAITTGFSNQPR